MQYFFKNFVLPTGMLIASIIGAGMFALPFVFHQSGIGSGVFYLVCFGILASLIHLLYADIIVRTRETRRQFPGYIRRYLGENAGTFAEYLVFTTLLLTLTAYLTLSASFLTIILPALSPLTATLLFWILATTTIFITIKRTATFNAVTAAITLTAIGGLFFHWGFMVPFNPDAFPVFTANNFLVPFGPVLFSFLGFSAIPALVAYAHKESVPPLYIKKSIIIGSLLPALFYFFYVIAVWGMSPTVSPDSVSGLIGNVPFFILFTIGVLGFVSLWDSYSAIGRDIDKLLTYEWHMSTETAFFITVGAPLVFYLLGLNNFIAIISAVGGILFGIWGVFIVLAWKKAVKVRVSSVKFSTLSIPEHPYPLVNRMPFPIIIILLLVFAGGIIYETIHLVSLF